MKACSFPMWSRDSYVRDGDSSVSSGRLSGSSGGHESCAPFHGPWKERPPLVLGPQRHPRKSNPRLEQLKDKIRAQAQWQASCASLGTSVPSSASRLYRASSTKLRRKTPKVTSTLPAPTYSGLSILRAERRGRGRGRDRVPVSLGQEFSSVPQHQTSVPRTSAKRIQSASRKTEALRSPAARGRDSELADVYAWRKGQALVRQLIGPRPTLPQLRSKAPSAELGADMKAAAGKGAPAHARLSRPTFNCSDQPVSKCTPSLVSQDQLAAIQAAMAILQDLRQQIQAGLDLARRPRVAWKPIPSKVKPQDQAGMGQQRLQSPQDIADSLSKSMQTVPEGTGSSLDRAGGFHSQQHWSPLAEWESHPQRAWRAQGEDASFQRQGSPTKNPQSFSQHPQSTLAGQIYPQRAWAGQEEDISFQRPRSPREKPQSFSLRPWSALSEHIYPQRAWAAQEQDISFQRPGCPPEKLSAFPQRPRGAMASQASSKRAWESCDDWEIPGYHLWSSLNRPRSARPRPWSSSFVRRSSPRSKGPNAVSLPSKAKQAWREPAQDFLRNPLAKEQDTQPCPRLQGSLGQPHSSESLRDFMRRKAQARRQQAIEQKALAARTLELRNQRLQEVHRKQREAIHSKAVPLISQRSPSIVTFVPSSAQSGDLEAHKTLQSPLQKWSTVTSGMVLGAQEGPDRPWNLLETLDTRGPGNGFKQARLQALETMADVLKQRIDILTTKLHRSTSPDAASNVASDVLPSDPSTPPATIALTPPTHLGALASNRGQGAPQDRVDSQATPFLLTAYSPDCVKPPWSPSWERRSLSPGAHLKSQSQGPLPSTPTPASQVNPQPCCSGPSSMHLVLSKMAIEKRHWELKKRLQKEMVTLQALGDCVRSSLGVPVAPDPARGSLWLEEMAEAKGADSVMPWSTRSCGLQKLRGLHCRGQREGHLANFHMKSLSFLDSLKLEQQKQEQALAHLRQQAEQEVWETQMAVDKLLSKNQFKQLIRKYIAQPSPEKASELEQQVIRKHEAQPNPEKSWEMEQQLIRKYTAQPSPEKASELEKLQTRGCAEPSTLSPSAMTTRSRSLPPLGRDAAMSSQCPEEEKADKAVSAEQGQQDPCPSQLTLAKFSPSDSHTYQWGTARPEPGTGRSRTFHRFNIVMMEQSLRDEELRAQHQAAVLRLREMVLEEKARSELAWLEHQIGCLGGLRHETTQATLCEKQQQALSRLEKERREIQSLKKVYLSLHRDRKQLLQHQQSILQVQKSMAHLWQDMQGRTQILQDASPRVEAAWEGASETSQKLEGILCPVTTCKPSSPPSCHPQRSPENSEVQGPSPEQQEAAPPQTALKAEDPHQPLKLRWKDKAPGTGGSLVDTSHAGQEPGKQPCIPLPGQLHWPSQDPGHQWSPAFPAIKEDGSPASQLRPQEAKEAPSGELLTKPSAASKLERSLAPADSHAWSLQNGQSLSGESPCLWEARQVTEGSTGQEETESGVGVFRSLEGKAQEEAFEQSGQQRTEISQQEDPNISSIQLDSEQMDASSVPMASEEGLPAQHPGSPHAPPAAFLDLCSGSSEAPASSPASVGSASSLSCSSLKEFQKATATLVQLSDSPTSLSSLEAEDTLHMAPSCSQELGAHDSWKEPGLPSSWGLHQDHSQLEGVLRNVGLLTQQRLEDNGTTCPCASSEEAAMAAGSEPGCGFLCVGWPETFPDVPSPRLGSELSETSSQIWDEDSAENLLEPGSCVEPPLGWAGGSLDPEGSGKAGAAPPSLGPGEEQEASGTSRSLTGALSTGKPRQGSPVALCTTLLLHSPPSSDLNRSLSISLDTSTSEGVDLSRGDRPAQASASCQEGPQGADLSPSMERKALQASLEPKATMSLQGEPPGAKDPKAMWEEDRGPPVTEVTSPSCASGFLTEILSPVDEELSYGSDDLPSSTHRDPHLPPPPITPQAKSDSNEANPISENFPSPPEEAMFPGGSLGSLGVDMSITAEDVSSLSDDTLEKALSPGPQESGCCLGPVGQDRGLDVSSFVVGSQVKDRQWSEPVSQPGPPSSTGLRSSPGRSLKSTQPPTPSPLACVTREGLSRLPVAGTTVALLGRQQGPGAPTPCLESSAGSAMEATLDSQGGPWETMQIFEGARCQPGTGHLLDRKADTSPQASEAPPQSPGPSVACSQAESLANTGEEVGGDLSQGTAPAQAPELAGQRTALWESLDI